MAFSVKGKNVLLTGGAKGIGKGIAEVFLKEGANLVFTGRNVEVAKDAEKEFKKINEKSWDKYFILSKSPIVFSCSAIREEKSTLSSDKNSSNSISSLEKWWTSSAFINNNVS